MQRLTRARTVLALALVGALALAGCGGGGDNGAEQDLRDQLAMLQTDLDAANAAKMTAEAAQAAAAEAQADAEAAQATAETDRDAANTAKGAAEQAATNAMAAQAAAEGAQTEAEAAQATAEAAQIAAQTAQATAETDRDAAKAAQMAADAAQATAEAAQVAAVAAQATAESERDAAMAAEMAAMEAQAAAEAAQTAAEQAAATAMAAQAAAEAERDTNAEALAAAEAARNAAKDAEAAAKVAQAQAEAAQATAEADSADAMTAQAAAEAAQATAEAAQAAAEAAQAEAEMQRDAANTAKTAAAEAQATAEMERDAANDAQMAAETAKAEADAKAMKAEEDRDKYMKMAEDAEAAKMAAEQRAEDAEAAKKVAEDTLAALQGTVDTGDVMEDNAEAKALLAVLKDNNVADGNDSGLAMSPENEDGDDSAEDMARKQGTRNDVSNLMVEVSKDGMLMAEVEDNDDYSMPPDMAPDMIDGWRGVMLTKDNADGTMDTVVAYSNIGDDGMASLLDRYLSDRPTTTKPRTWTVTTLDAEGDPTIDGQIPWSEVERPDTKTSFAGIDVAMLTFKGTVHDISGTFSCEGPCSAPARYSGGKVNTTAATDDDDAAAGTWTFVPDEGVSLYTDDTTYLTFGWWLDKDAGGKPKDFLAFSTATGLGVIRAAVGEGSASGGVVSTLAANAVGTEGSEIRGSATYKGAAAGKYATASTISPTYEGGHFTADATLTVNFDAESEADEATANNRDGVALSGMIDNFMTGDTSRPGWSVKLMVDNDTDRATPATPVANLVVASPAEMMHTEWSTGGVAKGTGTWTARWYGGVTATDEDITKGAPAAAVGTFNANIGDAARLQGAFGAMKTME